MTMAVCFKCGEIKHGAFNACNMCGAQPINENDLAMSMAMTDHYHKEPTLRQMGQDIKSGHPPKLDPESRNWLIEDIRKSGILKMIQVTDIKGNDDLLSIKKPWWKIF
jgi:hypothetical protein